MKRLEGLNRGYLEVQKALTGKKYILAGNLVGILSYVENKNWRIVRNSDEAVFLCTKNRRIEGREDPKKSLFCRPATNKNNRAPTASPQQ